MPRKARVVLIQFNDHVKCRVGDNSANKKIEKECDFMKKQLQGIALILISILLMLGYGNAPVFDLSFRWSLIFSIIGIVGVVMTFLPDKKDW